MNNFFALVHIEREDGHKILMMTEPGIIGKIGMNSAGMGICLNILMGESRGINLPIHVLLRIALDATSIDEAYRKIEQASFDSCSNIILGDEQGRLPRP